MNRHAKAPSAGSSMRRAKGLGRTVRGAFALALVLAAFLGIGASAAVAAEPTVTVNDVTERTIVTAQLSGTLEVPADFEETYWCFEYTPASQNEWQLVNETCGPAIPPNGKAEEIKNPINILSAGTSYEVRVVIAFASDGFALHSSAPSKPFTTDPATEPTLALDAPGSISIASAHLSGTIDPNGGTTDPIAGLQPIKWQLQVAPASEPTKWQNAASGTLTGEEAESPDAGFPSPIEVSGDATNLKANTTYKVRLVAHPAGATTVLPEGEWKQFTTQALTNHPTVTVEPATQIAFTHAHISGKVNPHGGNSDTLTGTIPVAWSLEYTKASEPGNWQPAAEGTLTEAQDVAAEGVEIKADLHGLHANTSYLYRLTAGSAGEVAPPAEGGFETLSTTGPTIATEPATNVSTTHAQLNGTVDPNEEATTYFFEYGTEDCAVSACTATPPQEVDGGELLELAHRGPGPHPFAVGKAIAPLQPAIVYHFRLVAENGAGTTHGADQTFITTPEPAPQSCPNEARREEQHSKYLPDCRAYELVSPPGAGKNGADVMPNTSHVQVAATETPALPMAASFASLSAFGDAAGTGVATEYLSQRDATPDTSGWSTHAITPAQEPSTVFSAALTFVPEYVGDLSPDLTAGAFRAWSPLTPDTMVAKTLNLYSRDDLRSPGTGHYLLATACPLCEETETALPPLPFGPLGQQARPTFDTASADFHHLLFELRADLVEGAAGRNPKAYVSDNGGLHIVSNGSAACPGNEGEAATSPCSGAGDGEAISRRLTADRAMSADGTRVDFTTPTTNGTANTLSKLFQLADGGTASPADDAVFQLNASEKAIPTSTGAATYQTASTDGSRVFFSSNEPLTEAESSGLYMWKRAEHDETQRLAIDAEGGTFTLVARSQPSYGIGNLSAGSETVSGVAGAFEVGQTLEGAGIPAGTTITAIEEENSSHSIFTISQPASVNAAGAALSASMQATTPPLPFDASATAVQAALETLRLEAPNTLPIPLYGQGNVQVSGGPGDAGAGHPYEIEFTGALAGVNVMPVLADGSSLTGAAHSATVTVTEPVHNLTLIAPTNGSAIFGASDDGHRLYFTASDDLVPGMPPKTFATSVFLWDEDAGSGGRIFFVGSLLSLDVESNRYGQLFRSEPKESRVSPDGRRLLFQSSSGSSLAPAYQHGTCTNTDTSVGGFCKELYLYSEDGSTPARPDVACVSCNLTNPGEERSGGTDTPGHAVLNVLSGIGGSGVNFHLNNAISPDDRYVFFSTDAPLVEADTNERYDAYEYDTATGEAHLLSSGTDPSNSYFMSADANGHNALFVTRQRLSRWDSDASLDLYDARLGGGFPEPPASNTEPCEGETCHEGAPSAPSAPPVGSGAAGPGNPKSPLRCPKGRHPAKKNGKTRCVANKHGKRPARANRRISR